MPFGKWFIRDLSGHYEFGGDDDGIGPFDWGEVFFFSVGAWGMVFIVAGAIFQSWTTVLVGIALVVAPLVMVAGLIPFWAWQMRHDDCN